MESRILKLKNEFTDIINIRVTVNNVFDILQVRIDKLNVYYSEFIKNNKNQMFIFGLDSFQFQSKLIDIEYEDMKRMFLVINNRMYCEYFKLNKLIIDYILTNINDKKIIDVIKVNNFPIYKDLEPFKEYSFDIILGIHENILNLLGILISTLNNKENELSMHKIKQNIGLNIDNFITTFNYNITIMREKVTMFITYIDFFHKMHTKYLKRFSNKIQLMNSLINNDIKFDESMEMNNDKKRELIDNLDIDTNDKELLKDFKKTLNSESYDSEKESNITHNNLVIFDSNNSITSSISSKSFKSSDNKSKTSIQEIFTRKVSNILQICMPKNTNKVIHPNLTQEEITDLFINIDESCNTIIQNNENVELIVEEEKEVEPILEEILAEEKKVLIEEEKEVLIEEEKEEDPNSIVEEDLNLIEEPNLIEVEEPKELNLLKEELNPILKEEPNPILKEEPKEPNQILKEEPNPILKEDPNPILKEDENILKKKRAYKPKKKT